MARIFSRKRNLNLAGRKRSFKKLYLFVVLFCAVFFLISVFFLTKSDILKIKLVEVKLDKISCSDSNQVKNSTGLIGQNILFVDSQKIQELIKSKFICVKEVNVSRSFPNQIKLSVLGRTAVAKLSLLKVIEATSSSFLEDIATPSAEQASDSFLIDNEGVAFSKSIGQMESPNIYYNDSSISLGKKLDSATRNILEIIEKVKVFGLDVSKSLISDNNFVIFSSPKVIFRLDSKVEIQLASLQLILEKAKIENVRLQFVDLRFDKPAVKFAPKK